MSAEHAIAARFVHARRSALALPEYPGAIPADRETAYACQDAAIDMWPDEVAGWKVGRVMAPWLEPFGEDRLVGPIFRGSIHPAPQGAVVDFPVFEGGFAAVEAEFVVRLAGDAPPGKTSWTAEEAASLVAALHIGVEPAGSPLATINDLGPAVIVSDFGNNAGLIVGPAISGWRGRSSESLLSETFIEGRSVGRGTAASVPGGPLAALAFALGRCARRGRPLKAGAFVSTGATTGIHPIRAGQNARVNFGACGEIRCRAIRAEAHTEAA